MRVNWLVGVTSAIALAGCSPPKPKNLDSEDPGKYAQKIKSQVYSFVEEARRNPRSVSEQGAVLLEELDIYQKQPVGSHGSIYAQLLQSCQQLVEAAKTAGGKAEVDKKLSEMKALADQLPGEIRAERPDRAGRPGS
jgi:hypothetical protein